MILREWVKNSDPAKMPAGMDAVRERALNTKRDPYSRLIETAHKG